MKIIDVAQEFADLNIFNRTTRTTLLEKVSLFCRRSEIDNVEDVSLNIIGIFKTRTLEIARPVTYNGYLRYMRLVFDYAVSRGYANENLFRTVRVAPIGVVPRKIIERETIEEVSKHLFENPTKYKPCWFWLSVIYTLYFTGMRRRQLVSLKLRDINFNEGTITLSYEGSKTRRSWLIPMHDEISSLLHDLVLRTEIATRRRMKPNDYLFVAGRFHYRYGITADGGMAPESVTGFFRRLANGLGKEVGAHRFRHTFATELCNPSGDTDPDIFTVQAILGHTSIQTTRGYVQSNAKRMRQTIDKMDSPFSKKFVPELTFPS